MCDLAFVGKTSILKQLLYGNNIVGSEMFETQEDIYVGSIKTDRGVREQVRFYDMRGLRDGAELSKHCFSCTDGYVLVYRTENRESFQRVELTSPRTKRRSPSWSLAISVSGRSSDV